MIPAMAMPWSHRPHAGMFDVKNYERSCSTDVRLVVHIPITVFVRERALFRLSFIVSDFLSANLPELAAQHNCPNGGFDVIVIRFQFVPHLREQRLVRQ